MLLPVWLSPPHLSPSQSAVERGARWNCLSRVNEIWSMFTQILRHRTLKGSRGQRCSLCPCSELSPTATQHVGDILLLSSGSRTTRRPLPTPPSPARRWSSAPTTPPSVGGRGAAPGRGAGTRPRGLRPAAPPFGSCTGQFFLRAHQRVEAGCRSLRSLPASALLSPALPVGFPKAHFLSFPFFSCLFSKLPPLICASSSVPLFRLLPPPPLHSSLFSLAPSVRHSGLADELDM